MKIDKIILRRIELPFVDFFETSFGRVSVKKAVLVEVESKGLSGWGESVAAEGPFYSPEDVETSWHVLTRFLAPSLLGGQGDPALFPGQVSRVRGHPMAKAAVEMALWDLEARAEGKPLWRLLGGTRDRIPCGVSIGIQDTMEELLRKIEKEVSDGYRRIKIKIKPGWDVETVRVVREEFPDVPLMVDANAAYTPGDREHLQRLDRYHLLMLEQPLYSDDLVEHSRLQSDLRTPLCLDESIRHARDARHACELGACRIVNLKAGRVGGLIEAMKVHDTCREFGVPVWCGGMLETGIGRAHNIALSTLENFSLPGDVSAAERYFERDTVTPPIEITGDGFMIPPGDPGIGYQPDLQWIEEITVRKQVVEP